MSRNTTYFPTNSVAIAQTGHVKRTASSSTSLMGSEPSSSSRRLSLACPHCKTPVLDIPAEILEFDDEGDITPPQPKRWSRRHNWISRPIKRKDSDASTLAPLPENSLGFDFANTSKHRRRGSISSVISDSSSQTKVETPPPPRSILSHVPSISSGKGSTLTAKRSVKFSDEPVYYDYSYRYSHACEHEIPHAPYCKLGYDCNGECMYNDYDYDYDYDVDMFSFEQPEEIPSAKKWGLFSRFVAWLRRKTGTRHYTIEEGKRRPVISRPQPLTPRSIPCGSMGLDDGRRVLRTKARRPVDKVWQDYNSCG